VTGITRTTLSNKKILTRWVLFRHSVYIVAEATSKFRERKPEDAKVRLDLTLARATFCGQRWCGHFLCAEFPPGPLVDRGVSEVPGRTATRLGTSTLRSRALAAPRP
jgi:hypothetical protein